MSDAAEGGHIEVLKWAKDNGCDFTNTYLCEHASKGGHLESLKWLRDTVGCFWDEMSCAEAARNGHEVLQWIHGIKRGV